MKPARGSAASPRPPAVWPLLPAPQASSQLCGWPAGDLSQGPLPQCSHLFQRWADGLSVPTAPWGLTLFQPHTRGSGLSGGTAAGPKELAGGRGALLKGREWGSASHCAAIPAVPSVSQGPPPPLVGWSLPVLPTQGMGALWSPPWAPVAPCRASTTSREEPSLVGPPGEAGLRVSGDKGNHTGSASSLGPWWLPWTSWGPGAATAGSGTPLGLPGAGGLAAVLGQALSREAPGGRLSASGLRPLVPRVDGTASGRVGARGGRLGHTGGGGGGLWGQAWPGWVGPLPGPSRLLMGFQAGAGTSWDLPLTRALGGELICLSHTYLPGKGQPGFPAEAGPGAKPS